VHYLGKAATLLLLYAFPVLLIAQGTTHDVSRALVCGSIRLAAF